jgi:RES domain-containing protein
MTVYRITLEQWSRQLTASGFPARWSSRGNFMIYTAGSRALACLENLVHRSGEGSNALFKVMLIEIPDKITIETLDIKKLKRDWYSMQHYPYCQVLGDTWLKELRSAVLQVPSSVIQQEHNYLINPAHPDFKKIKLSGVESFDFDERFK